MNPKSALPWRSITLALVAVGLIVLGLGGWLTPVARLALSPLVAAQSWLSERYQAIQFYLTAPRDVNELMQRNAELEAEVAHLQSQIIELQQQLGEYRVLAALLDFARTFPDYSYLSASVIGRDPSPFVHYVHIDRGSDDGLRRGMPVVSQQGLVGRVAQVTANAALVQLITDPEVSINVRLQPSDADAVLTGSVTGDVSLTMIPQEAKVQPGDLVLTSGLGGNYPPNILIGQVTGVRTRPFDLFQSASVQPVVDFNRLSIVLVITNFQPVDVSPLIPTPQAP
ncbi:MAG: rod shape-determining protein MreC [Anaerolineae bacterium]|nr:MAG: rod shape-determining protein MreC [Anaerolineae bacterium]